MGFRAGDLDFLAWRVLLIMAFLPRFLKCSLSDSYCGFREFTNQGVVVGLGGTKA